MTVLAVWIKTCTAVAFDAERYLIILYKLFIRL